MATRLRPVRFGLTTAIVWCAYVFFLGVMATYLNWGNAMQSVIRSIYPGYRKTPGGIVIGSIWAFFDGFFGGTAFAWIYNLLACSRHSNRLETGRKK
jgi:hypothetical protein